MKFVLQISCKVESGQTHLRGVQKNRFYVMNTCKASELALSQFFLPAFLELRLLLPLALAFALLNG